MTAATAGSSQGRRDDPRLAAGAEKWTVKCFWQSVMVSDDDAAYGRLNLIYVSQRLKSYLMLVFVFRVFFLLFLLYTVIVVGSRPDTEQGYVFVRANT